MTWADLPTKLKIYISILSVLGLFVFIWAIWNLAVNPPGSWWIVLLGLACATLPFNIFLDSVNTAVGIGDAYTMAITMIFGPSPGIVVTFIQSLVISTCRPRQRVSPYKVVFNVASTICGAWLYGTIYKSLTNNTPEPQDIVVPAAILVATYFFSNSILTSLAIAWSNGESVVKFWVKACMPLFNDYLISSFIATLLVVIYSFKSWLCLIAAPAVFIVWVWNKYNQTRIIQAQKHLEEQEQLYFRTVESLALAIDAKDQTTYGHIRRVRSYAIGLAQLCGIKDDNELKAIQTGALLHDIGKLAVADYILNKPGRLSEKEFEEVKTHTTAGDEILKPVGFPYPVATYVRYHHERWDGLGYPDGLKGEQIPLGARILAIADAFDAIRFSRPYKLSVSTDEALEILHAQTGTFYDPKLVALFTSHVDTLEATAIKESQNAPKLSFRSKIEDVEVASLLAGNQNVFRDVPAELIQLSELCSALPGYLRLEDILPAISRRLEVLVPFSTCVFYLNHNSENRLVAKYVSGKFSELLKGHRLEMGKGISGWVAAYGRPMINTGPSLDFQDLSSDITSLNDALVVPIVQRDECFGTISLYAQEPDTYGHYELSILLTLASILAPLISQSNRSELTESQDIIDPTTQLRRVSYLTTIGPQLISSAGETRTPISLIYLEIRNLGQIIRIFGSHLGDLIIEKAADCIKPELRETDILVRYGHQAFVALLPGVRDDQALRCIERLKQQIEREAPTPGQGFAIDLRASVSYYPKDGSSVLALLQSAQESVRLGSVPKSMPGTNVIEFSRA